MYHMKNIVSLDEQLHYPKCMYRIRNVLEECEKDETEINISDQVMKLLKPYVLESILSLNTCETCETMIIDNLYNNSGTTSFTLLFSRVKEKMPNTQIIELEDRQDKLLLKLDILYERIKNISSLCKINIEEDTKKKTIDTVSIIPLEHKYTTTVRIIPEEIVIVLNCTNLPWFLNKFLKEVQPSSVSWHLHSSVPIEKIPIIKAFFQKYQNLYKVQEGSKINLRLIFKCESTVPELKISSLAVPLLGTVNIIRYLCLTFDNSAPYDYFNHEVDALLDLGHQLEKASEKNKAPLISKIFSQCKEWIYRNNFSIVDLVVYNVMNQFQNGMKYVPKKWLNNCEEIII